MIFIDNLLVRIHLIIETILADRPCAMGDGIPFSRKPNIYLPMRVCSFTFRVCGVGVMFKVPYPKAPNPELYTHPLCCDPCDTGISRFYLIECIDSIILESQHFLIPFIQYTVSDKIALLRGVGSEVRGVR